MILQPAVRWPAGRWTILLRPSPQPQKRTMAIARTTSTKKGASQPKPKPPPLPIIPTDRSVHYHKILTKNPAKPLRTAFAVYPPAPAISKRHPATLEAYEAKQIRRLDPTGFRTALFSRKNPDSARVGDVLQVSNTRGEPFAGVLLSVRRRGVDTALLLRNTVARLGVEIWFKLYSPGLRGIDIVSRRARRARRARLFYMRQPKHDRGNVEHLVEAWRRTRNVISTRKVGEKKAEVGGKGKGKGKKR